VLKWARANGCPWDWRTGAKAVKGGHLDVLQWAGANGCPWTATTCCWAAEGGHLEALQWARANGCPWDKTTCARAATGGHLEMLQWARANGCPWGKATCRNAASSNHLEVLQWARANGCPSLQIKRWRLPGAGRALQTRLVFLFGKANKRRTKGHRNCTDGALGGQDTRYWKEVVFIQLRRGLGSPPSGSAYRMA
jgi:hypothetical protein